MLISIITPTYNRANTFLIKNIKSIQLQREEGFEHEHIVIDNASTDETEEIVKKFAQNDPRIKYIRNSGNFGPANALNKGLQIAQGQLILPLDDDDLLFRSSLQIHYDFMTTNDIDWSFGYMINITDEDKLLGDVSDRNVEYDPDPEKMFQIIYKTNYLTEGSSIFKKSCLKKVDGWDENVKCQDWDIVLKMLYAKFSYKLNKNYVALYRVHNEQLTATHSKDGTYENDKLYWAKKYYLPT
jgi:glycosyltransferase involved in cell wall biosynthesis